MNENMLIGIAIGLGGFVIFLIFLMVKAFVVIKELSKEVRMHKDTLDQLYRNQMKADDRITKVDDRCERTKGSIEVLSTSLGSAEKRISRIEEAHNSVLLKAIERIIEAVEKANNPLAEKDAGSENRAVSEASEGIPEGENVFTAETGDTYSGEILNGADCDGDFCEISVENESRKRMLEEFANSNQKALHLTTERAYSDDQCDSEGKAVVQEVSYRWIFPSRDSESVPVFGQWYMVVGELKGQVKSDGSGIISTREAMWNWHDFVTTEDERFEKVYAYILPPSSADIMEQVVSLALEKAG